jgi:hypothetical protein
LAFLLLVVLVLVLGFFRDFEDEDDEENEDDLVVTPFSDSLLGFSFLGHYSELCLFCFQTTAI